MDEKTKEALEKIEEIMTELVTKLETIKDELDDELQEEQEKDEESIDEGKVDKLEDTTNQLESALAFLENARDELKSIA